MTTDRHDDDLTAILQAARSAPRRGWRERALARMRGVRPRRSRRWVLAFVVAGILLLGGIGVVAGVIPLFVEGELYFRSANAGPGWTDVTGISILSGDSERSDGFPTSDGDASPVSDEMVWSDFASPWPHYRGDIWKAHRDGSGAVNLTELAGLGGMNCRPRWSPDGSMILFQHSDPEPGEYACEVGWHLWVMGADGSGAHRLTPEGTPPTENGTWSPDGLWILCQIGDAEAEYSGAAKIHISGADIRPLPSVGADARWSPDGSWIASSRTEEGELEGEPGYWRQLLLTDAEGGGPEALIEQFIVEAELAANYPNEEQLASNPDFDWLGDVRTWVGPRDPTWSPGGDKIAFLAAMPFDAYGPYYRNQVEIWIYDLETDEAVQVTYDDVAQYSPRWQR
jgi:dipeptidyl aminopeptidase/acylaminoacyl peptidase